MTIDVTVSCGAIGQFASAFMQTWELTMTLLKAFWQAWQAGTFLRRFGG